jgi:DNA-binding transcriptional LysR family regulator
MSRDLSWDNQRTFLAVLETGSLSGGARQLGLTQPTVRARRAR